jgi:hypothetical protein
LELCKPLATVTIDYVIDKSFRRIFPNVNVHDEELLRTRTLLVTDHGRV